MNIGSRATPGWVSSAGPAVPPVAAGMASTTVSRVAAQQIGTDHQHEPARLPAEHVAGE